MKAIALCLMVAGQLLSTAFVQASPAAQDEDGRWTINMRDADIRDFTEQVASISGQTLVVDPRVKGQVTVISQEPLTLSEVYQLFLSVMSTHGYAVVTQGDQARVVPDGEARSVASNAGTGPDTLETRLLQVQQTPVAELLPLIRPLVPAHGHLAAIPSSNALIVSDKRANIERLIELIAQADRASSDDSSFYDLRHAWANDVAAALLESLRRGQPQGGSNSQVIADTRTNRLLLLGTPEARQRLLKLAQRLDVPSVRSANTRVIRLRHGDAKAMAQTLGELSEQLRPQAKDGGGQPPVLIRADEGLNALVLLAEPDIVSQLEDIVRQLDVPRAQVLVEAAIVEMSGDVSEALGVQWAIDGRDGKGSIGGVNFGNTGLSVGTLLGAISSDTPISLPDGAIIGVGNDNFGALVTALSANSSSNLLSTPSLLTLDNQKAEILVGQNVPFQTGSYTTDAAGANNPFTTIERQDIGVSLKVTPHINEGATLRLEIEQEISSLAPSAQAVDLVTNKRSSKDVKVKRNLMVFLRPSVVRDAAGLANLSQEKYQGIRVLDQASLLPNNPQQLFEPAAPAANALDLRPAATTPTAQPFAAPPRTLLEKPKVIDPATLRNGQGGESLSRAPSKPPLPVLAKASTALPTPPAKRYAIELISGTGEAYMLALLKRHPREPLRLQRDQRDGQPWFRVLYGNYPDRALAERVMASLPSGLPHQRAQVVTL